MTDAVEAKPVTAMQAPTNNPSLNYKTEQKRLVLLENLKDNQITTTETNNRKLKKMIFTKAMTIVLLFIVLYHYKSSQDINDYIIL